MYGSVWVDLHAPKDQAASWLGAMQARFGPLPCNQEFRPLGLGKSLGLIPHITAWGSYFYPRSPPPALTHPLTPLLTHFAILHTPHRPPTPPKQKPRPDSPRAQASSLVGLVIGYTVAGTGSDPGFSL